MSFLKMFKVCFVWILLVLISLSRSVQSLCRYRDVGDMPPEIFEYWADWGCYVYTRPDMFAAHQLQASRCYKKLNGTLYDIPGLINEERCIPFSKGDEFIKLSVERTFKEPETMQRWISCCLDARKCCNSVMLESKPDGENFCPSVWDGWSCFPAIPPDRTYRQVCSRYAYSRQPPECHHFSTKKCFDNGTWEDKTDYSACDITPGLIFRSIWHMSVLSISIIVCVPTILIMIIYPTLHTEKLIMIRTLLIVLVLRNLFVIIVKGSLILDELTSIGPTIMSGNDWSCRMLSAFEKFFGTAVFTCMLMEGIYLYQMLTNVFRARIRGGIPTTELYVAGFVITTVVTLAWALAMALNGKEHCWQVTEGTNFHWIFDGPRLIMLTVNFGLLMRIIWALWSTFNLRQEEQHPVFRTAKSALICLPLFGVPFLLLAVRPDTTECVLEQSYYLVYYTVEALQGVLIAVLHCYSEKEVKLKITSQCKWIKRKFSNICSCNKELRFSERSRRKRPPSEISRSSTPRSSTQSRRESNTSNTTLTTPQCDSLREKINFPLPRIQEDDEKHSNNGSNAGRMVKSRLSAGDISDVGSTYSKTGSFETQPRRHSDGETENDRSEVLI